jgi:predicted Fe-S protein YdhL (DUF1289 family)
MTNIFPETKEDTMNDVLIASPCISICVLDENDVCAGCYRSAAEITRWSQADNPERHSILTSAAERARAANPFA